MAHIKVDVESNLVEVDGSTPEVATCIDLLLNSWKKRVSKLEFMHFKFTIVHSILFHFFTDEEVIMCMQAYERFLDYMKGKTDEK